MRVLNVGENRLEALPFESLAGMPLTELVARSNKLTGTLIEADVSALPGLVSLDVSSNQLTRVVPPGRSIALPAVQRVTLSLNRLQALPDVSSWTSLATLAADENAIGEVPEGLTSLDRLRHVDLSSNDVKVVPPEIARMDGLVTLRLAGNPLRDKKFASISTEELKDILTARLEPPPPYHVGIAQTVDTFEEVKPAGVLEEQQHEDDGRSSEFDHYATPPTSAPHSPARSRANTRSATPSAQVWPVKNGLLDRSSTDSSTLHPVICARVAGGEPRHARAPPPQPLRGGAGGPVVLRGDTDGAESRAQPARGGDVPPRGAGAPRAKGAQPLVEPGYGLGAACEEPPGPGAGEVGCLDE